MQNFLEAFPAYKKKPLNNKARTSMPVYAILVFLMICVLWVIQIYVNLLFLKKNHGSIEEKSE
jgi:hypothetical protein